MCRLKPVLSPFQKKVYDIVACIPKGRVSTYAAVAKAIGCGSPRAVGQALRVNPFAPEVPCHRVISSSLKAGGFQGETQGTSVLKKLGLLRREGVEFDRSGILQDQSRLMLFE